MSPQIMLIWTVVLILLVLSNRDIKADLAECQLQEQTNEVTTHD